MLSFCEEQNEEIEAVKEYVVAPNDILTISVYQEPDLSVTVRVSQDGTISYPLLGNIKAAGLSIRELEKEMSNLLAQDYLVNPQVNIFVKEYGKISILGEVRKPGSYEMKERLTLTIAIALAGDFTETADTRMVKIIRTNADGKKQTIEVDISRILSREIPDLELKAGDTIIAEELGRVSIIGQVARPGVYNLKQGTTVVDAIAQAGGFTPTAAQDAVRVNRTENGEKKTIRVPVGSILRGGDKSLDMTLEPDDTIVVPESFF